MFGDWVAHDGLVALASAKKEGLEGMDAVLRSFQFPTTYDFDSLWLHVEEWDRRYPDGNGQGFALNSEDLTYFRNKELQRLYQWVKIRDDQGKTMGTLYLTSSSGELQSMFVVRMQRGLPPNPYVRNFVSHVKWESWETQNFDRGAAQVNAIQELSCWDTQARLQAEKERERRLIAETPIPWKPNPPRSDESLLSDIYADRARLERVSRGDFRAPGESFAWECLRLCNASWGKRTAGLLPVNIIPIPAVDGDTGFHFFAGKQSFRVRGSKLAPVLFELVQSGVQHVPLEWVRKLTQCPLSSR